MNAQGNLEAIGAITGFVIFLLVVFAYIYPALCNAGITLLCGI
jgi:hypothetical protein